MKSPVFILTLLISCFLGSCSKTVREFPFLKAQPSLTAGYTEYIIPAGAHYTTKNPVTAISTDQLKFQVIFDSSCIYTNRLAENQHDINKLYGFSDCGMMHHENSARFGWLWNGSALEIYAYCYVNGERLSKKLGIARPMTALTMSIAVKGDSYLFTFNENTVSMPRHCASSTATGYRLYPYFGGDETAPHNVSVFIKEY